MSEDCFGGALEDMELMEDRPGTEDFSVEVIDPDLLSSLGTGFSPAEYERELKQYKVMFAILTIIR